MRVAPGDDAAVLGDGTTLSVDTLIEGVHFDQRLSAEDVGWKAVAVSVSDVAAMGVRPEWLLLSLSLPPSPDAHWLDAFAQGVAAACARWSVDLVGGDTTRSSGPRVVSTTVGGRAPERVCQRGNASVGEDIWVAGRVGLAGAGWALPEPPVECLAALRRPEPPVELALALVERGLARAMMDLSDGLSTDLPRLCAASRCGAVLLPDALPIPAALAGHPDAERLLWGGGDDYALLFTAPTEAADAVADLAEALGEPAWAIGRTVPGARLRFGDTELPRALWQHFSEQR